MQPDIIAIRQLFGMSQPSLLQAIEQYGHSIALEPGSVLIDYGRSISMVPLVLSGAIKVMRQDEDGREIFLYYLNPGETCAMSLTCCSMHQPSQIKAVAEDNTLIVAIPIEQHEQWMNIHRQWKELVANTYALRFQELLQTIDSIAFKKMDERLLEYLQIRFQQSSADELSITHQEIAHDLGTSREVISRLLKQLEQHHTIALGRNKILRGKKGHW